MFFSLQIKIGSNLWVLINSGNFTVVGSRELKLVRIWVFGSLQLSPLCHFISFDFSNYIALILFAENVVANIGTKKDWYLKRSKLWTIKWILYFYSVFSWCIFPLFNIFLLTLVPVTWLVSSYLILCMFGILFVPKFV